MKINRSKEWWLRLAESEGEATIGAGAAEPPAYSEHYARLAGRARPTNEEWRAMLAQMFDIKKRFFSDEI